MSCPPPTTHTVFRLTMIKNTQVRIGLLHVKDDQMSKKKEKHRIELEDIFKNTGNKRNVVLIEGAPGSGKSTLCVYICQQWGNNKLFQEFVLVIFIQLREPEIQKANCIADLLPGSDSSKSQRAADRICAKYGQGVLFILDGWDELPPHLQEDSIFRKLVQPKLSDDIQVHKSAVIVTSRPISSSDLQPIASSRIEVLGFTPEELLNYFTESLDGRIEVAKTLMERITEIPAVAGSCYLPLNASIILHLFKCDNYTLPTTQYGILSEVVLSCIIRHLKERTKLEDSSLLSLDDVAKVVKEPFQSLCKLAYKGMKKDNVVFSDLPPDFNTLGLLQGVQSFAKRGKIVSYNFLHKSVQELLTAYYIANYTSSEMKQLSMINKLFNDHCFSTVLQYYAAITKLKIPGIEDNLTAVAKKCGIENCNNEAKHLLLSLLHCLHEAQESSLCESIAHYLQYGVNFSDIILTPLDCLCISFFLSNINLTREFEVTISGCSIGNEGCRHLVSDLCIKYQRMSSHRTTSKFSMYLMDNDIQDQGVFCLSKLLLTSCIHVIDLSFNEHVSDPGVSYIGNQLKENTTLSSLNLSACKLTSKGAKDLSDALTTNNTLKKLNISLNSVRDEGIEHLAKAIKVNRGLKSLHLVSCGMTDAGLRHLACSLKQNNSLEVLHIWNDPVDELNILSDEGVLDLTRDLCDNSALRELWLPQDFLLFKTTLQKNINEKREENGLPLIKVEGGLLSVKHLYASNMSIFVYTGYGNTLKDIEMWKDNKII